MNMQKLWCRVCNKLVAAVIEEGSKAFLAPLLGGSAGAVLGGAHGGARRGIGGALLGLLLGAAVQAMIIPKPQQLVCGECGSHLN